MKKSIILSGMFFMLAAAACNNSSTEKEPASTPPPTPPPVEKAAPAANEQKDGTTIKVGNDGVSIESKDGSRKSNVKVSTDTTKIEISRPK